FSDTVTVIETICTDVDPLLTSKLNWSLYPNPSQGKLMMRLENAIPGAARLKLYSNLGVLVFEDPAFGIRNGIEMQVQLPTLPDGVYYLELSGTGYRLKEKLVIRK
ncbi:MAG TPA: T9SS type A sorting domain-containing protein, partial [Catalimonadaceae bacterium]|nr:T9SS type A sorting domain-containing protein [Catalimonadaceae bacterium]